MWKYILIRSAHFFSSWILLEMSQNIGINAYIWKWSLPCPLLSPPITAQICCTDSVCIVSVSCLYCVCIVFVLCLCCVCIVFVLCLCCVLTLYSNMFYSLDCPIGHSNTIILCYCNIVAERQILYLLSSAMQKAMILAVEQ